MEKNGTIVRYTSEELDAMIARGEDQTDWGKVDALSEEELEASIDHEDEGEFDWTHPIPGLPPAKQQLTIRLDLDIIEWFKQQGPRYQTRMNEVLKRYIQAQKN